MILKLLIYGLLTTIIILVATNLFIKKLGRLLRGTTFKITSGFLNLIACLTIFLLAIIIGKDFLYKIL